MNTACTLCRHALDRCAVLNGCDTCTDCAMAAIKASRRGTRAVTVTRSEWGVFTSVLRQVVDPDGRVHQGKVRPLIRGRIEPKRIGQMYRRAKSEGLLIDTGDREPSNDAVGRNTDKLDRIYLLRGAA